MIHHKPSNNTLSWKEMTFKHQSKCPFLGNDHNLYERPQSIFVFNVFHPPIAEQQVQPVHENLWLLHLLSAKQKHTFYIIIRVSNNTTN